MVPGVPEGVLLSVISGSLVVLVEEMGIVLSEGVVPGVPEGVLLSVV